MKAHHWSTAALLGTAFLFFAALLSQTAVVRAVPPTPTPTPTPAPSPTTPVLCPPGVYPADYDVDCAPWGPSAYLSHMAALGYTYPPQPLPAHPLPASWDSLPGKWYYAQVLRDGGRTLYPSLKDAAAGTRGRQLPPGFVYVSYYHTASYHGKLFYLVDEEGWWMRKNDLWAVAPSKFRGVILGRTPSHPFGWVLQPLKTKQTPGYAREDYTHHRLNRYDIVQVYDTREANGMKWYMIAPDEWIPQRLLALVFPRQSPPEGVSGERWIEVNLFEQTLAAYEHGRMVFATLVSTGRPPFWTRPGVFHIYKKLPSTRMRGAFAADRSDYYQLDDVPWTMYYDESRALHGAYWHDYFGYRTSHGCVNLTIADAHWLYEWAHIGDTVYVWDPSGKTPLEGSGGGP